jgi:chitinase
MDGYKKRDDFNPEDIYIDTGNSSRRPTKEELAERFGLLKCNGDNCEDEMQALGFSSLPVLGLTEVSPCTVDAGATPAGTVTVTVTASPLDAVPSAMSTISDLTTRVISAARSMITESVQDAFYDEGNPE